MLARRLLPTGSGGSFNPPPTNVRYCLYNGQTGLSDYEIGLATSDDSGATWTREASNPVLTGDPLNDWESYHAKDPSLVWDGSQWVCYYAAIDDSWLVGTYRIGRATSDDLLTWTKYASNPVISEGTAGEPDYGGACFPTVIYDAALAPPWRMWYAGWAVNNTETNRTVCYAESSDGLTWTKYGRVIPVGAGGAFDDAGTTPGCVVLTSGEAGRIFYSGFDGSYYRVASATFTDPADDATYTKQGQITGYTSSITVATRNWRSNMPRAILSSGTGYRVFVTLWNPDDSSGYEMCTTVTATDLTTWAAPSSQMFTIPGVSGWDSYSAENPSVCVAH